MFQPNSIRSLLKKRNMTKLTTQNQTGKNLTQFFSKTCTDFSSISKNNSDPDLQSILQAKLMIKQIDHQVSNIRTWRQHQKQLLQQKLRNNQDLFNLSKQQYEKYVQQKLQQEMLEDQKMIHKMKIDENKLNRNQLNNKSILIDNMNTQTLQSSQGGQVAYEDWQDDLYDPELMANITSADDKINEKKHMKVQTFQGLQDKHQAFLNSIAELSSSDVFTKKSKQLRNQENSKTNNLQTTTTLDKQKLKRQLDDIDRQLKQMQDLLKD